MKPWKSKIWVRHLKMFDLFRKNWSKSQMWQNIWGDSESSNFITKLWFNKSWWGFWHFICKLYLLIQIKPVIGIEWLLTWQAGPVQSVKIFEVATTLMATVTATAAETKKPSCNPSDLRKADWFSCYQRSPLICQHICFETDIPTHFDILTQK